mmetsp:Transcript_30187/g.57977  ORF Transcript_30187/g.57977 Transcript_30187/m.57977 type:complete len:208 (+) Transcript_30187:1272-1895(+)
MQLHGSFECKRGGAVDHALQLSPAEVLRRFCHCSQVDVRAHGIVGAHGFAQDLQYLSPALGIGQSHFNLDFQSPWAQQGGVQQIGPVRNAYNKYVVQPLHSVQLHQELVYHVVVHHRASAAVARAAAHLHARVDLVKDDDVQRAGVPKLGRVALRGRKQLPDVLLRLPHKALENVGPVHHQGLGHVERARQLARNQRLARSRRAVQQ